jgi:hypothetical protein
MADEECQELKNIKYKNMLLSGNLNTINTTTINTKQSNIDMFLDKESQLNKSEPWNKLNKTAKITQLNEYVDLISNEHKLSIAEITTLKGYLTESLDKKKLQHVKDVQYDKVTNKIKLIPCLHFNPVTRKFTIKRQEKRVSTLKSLGAGKPKHKVEPNGF